MYAYDGYYDQKFEAKRVRTYELHADIVEADKGKGVTIDAAGNGKVKLAGENDRVIGYLFSIEHRENDPGAQKLGAVALDGTVEVQVAAAGATEPAVGDILIGGATAGVLIKDGTGTGSVTVGRGPVVIATRDDGSDKYAMVSFDLA